MNKKNVFKDLAFWMIGFGMIIGLIFPIFVISVTQAPEGDIIKPSFFILCILAGIVVGLFNIMLAKTVVENKMKQLSRHMKHVENRIMEKVDNISGDDCMEDSCYIEVESDDAIGQSAHSFNALVKTLAYAFQTEKNVKNYTEMLSSILNLDQLAEEALLKLLNIFDAFGGAIVLVREGNMEVASSHGIKTPETLLASDLFWNVMKEKRSEVLKLPEDIVLNGALVDFRPKYVLFEPIIYKDEVLGAIVLAGVSEYDNENTSNIHLFGQGLALAFKNAIAHEQLQKLASKDPLTGIYNRRSGLERFHDEYIRTKRTNEPLGVLMFDIDHFKKVNDTYGHLIGDKVLIEVTKVVSSLLRAGDIFMRYGGEEFVIVVMDSTRKDLLIVAERIRAGIEELEILHNNHHLKVTVSIGIGVCQEHRLEDSMQLLNIADYKLYQAKESGRNQVVI